MLLSVHQLELAPESFRLLARNIAHSPIQCIDAWSMVNELKLRDRKIQYLEWSKRVKCEKISKLYYKIGKSEEVKQPATDLDQNDCTIIEDLEQLDNLNDAIRCEKKIVAMKQLIKPATLILREESDKTKMSSKAGLVKLRPLTEILHEQALFARKIRSREIPSTENNIAKKRMRKE